jgi:hypothetical protein
LLFAFRFEVLDQGRLIDGKGTVQLASRGLYYIFLLQFFCCIVISLEVFATVSHFHINIIFVGQGWELTIKNVS